MGQSRPLFCPFLITISKIQIEKNVAGLLGIRTRRMVGADDTTELYVNSSLYLLPSSTYFVSVYHSLAHFLDAHLLNTNYLIRVTFSLTRYQSLRPLTASEAVAAIIIILMIHTLNVAKKFPFLKLLSRKLSWISLLRNERQRVS